MLEKPPVLQDLGTREAVCWKASHAAGPGC